MSTFNLISHRLLAAAVGNDHGPETRLWSREKPGLQRQDRVNTLSLELLQADQSLRSAAARPLRAWASPVGT
jgi:hypothetical protein